MELEDPATSTCCLTTRVSQRGSTDVQTRYLCVKTGGLRALLVRQKKKKNPASGRLTITWGGCGEEMQLPAGDWLTDVREREREKESPS